MFLKRCSTNFVALIRSSSVVLTIVRAIITRIRYRASTKFRLFQLASGNGRSPEKFSITFLANNRAMHAASARLVQVFRVEHQGIDVSTLRKRMRLESTLNPAFRSILVL